MEIFQTIWTAINTPNPGLIQIISRPLMLIELTVTILLSLTLFNISYTKKQILYYVLILFSISVIFDFLVPESLVSIIHILLVPFVITLLFKTPFLKSIVIGVLPLIVIVVLETILVNIFSAFFDTAYELLATIPIYRLTLVLSIYLVIYLLYRVSKHFNITIKINFTNFFSTRSKLVLIFTFILVLISIALQVYLIIFYVDKLPFGIAIFNIITLLAYFILSLYSLIKTNTLANVNQDLEQTRLYNDTLQILHDNMRAFRHDFANIVQSIGGYVDTQDIDGLKKYYSQLLEDCQRVNNLSTLSPEVINHPAVYSLLTAKYHKADELGIKINLQIFLNLNDLNMKIYEFTRVLGILLDNAIEAASECEEKVINLEIRKDATSPRQLLIIQNTYNNKDVDTTRIFEKGYTTKTDTSQPHGLGLWEINQILKKNKNLALFTTKDETFFTQQFEIYNR